MTMRVLHPDEKTFLTLQQLQGYFMDGYYQIIGKQELKDLNSFLIKFEDYREGNKIRDTNLYNGLPYSIPSRSWKEKSLDINIIMKLISKHNRKLDVLDVGCWNGWLSNYLSNLGHHIIGTDIFTDEYDGLKCIKHYNSNYIALQLKLDDLFRIEGSFDLIIINRCMPYSRNPRKLLIDAIDRLSPRGILLITGLNFYRNSSIPSRRISKANRKFKDKYGIPLLSDSIKGYLDLGDFKMLSLNNVDLKPYRPIKNWIKKSLKISPLYYFGIVMRR